MTGALVTRQKASTQLDYVDPIVPSTAHQHTLLPTRQTSVHPPTKHWISTAIFDCSCQRGSCQPTKHRVPHRPQVTILGLGAFGVVHLVRHRGQHFALKAMSKARLKHVGLIRHVEREKEVMLECTTPFAVNLVATFADKHYIYMLMETVMGGELFTFLQSRTYPLSESSAKFYAGCVILALEHFQERSIVFRDLKPEVRDGRSGWVGCGAGKRGGEGMPVARKHCWASYVSPLVGRCLL